MITDVKNPVLIPFSFVTVFLTVFIFSCSNSTDMSKKKKPEQSTETQKLDQNMGSTDSTGLSTSPTQQANRKPDSVIPHSDEIREVPIGMPMSREVYDKMKKDAEKPLRKKASPKKDDGQQDN